MAFGTYDRWDGAYCILAPQRIPLDDELSEFVRNFVATSTEDRRRIRSRLTTDECYTLLTFSRRCAVFAMRERSRSCLEAGLSAMAAIDLARIDFRDFDTPIGLLGLAAVELEDYSVWATFQDAAILADEEVAGRIMAPLRRSWDPKTSGFVMVDTKFGPGFISSGLRQHGATYPLRRILVELVELIRADRYHTSHISLGSDLPRIWLAGVDDDALDDALAKIRAGCVLSGELRLSQSATDEDQMLFLFLVELSIESAAQALMRLAEIQRRKTKDPPLLGCQERRLFCVVLERAVVYGRRPVETVSSMTRFALPIGGILRKYSAPEA
jgi:hypothetical protein